MRYFVFLTGLNRDLSIVVKSLQPKTLEQAISFALSEEQEQRSKLEIHKYQTINQQTVRYCNLCNKPGHTSFNCRSKQNSQGFQKFNNNNYVRRVNNTPNQNQYQNPNTGFSQNQNKQVKICNYCKKFGHLINECRKREYNHQKRAMSVPHNSQNQQVQSNPLNFQAAQQPAMPSNSTHFIQTESQE